MLKPIVVGFSFAVAMTSALINHELLPQAVAMVAIAITTIGDKKL